MPANVGYVLHVADQHYIIAEQSFKMSSLSCHFCSTSTVCLRKSGTVLIPQKRPALAPTAQLGRPTDDGCLRTTLTGQFLPPSERHRRFTGALPPVFVSCFGFEAFAGAAGCRVGTVLSFGPRVFFSDPRTLHCASAQHQCVYILSNTLARSCQ